MIVKIDWYYNKDIETADISHHQHCLHQATGYNELWCCKCRQYFYFNRWGNLIKIGESVSSVLSR